MHAVVTDEPKIQLINPKMFNPMVVRQFGIKKPDLYNMGSPPMQEDDLDKPLEIFGDEAEVLGIIMSQMSLKEGLRLFGERAEAGATKEMKQLHDMKTFFPRDPKSLTREERIKALSSLIFLKEKSNGDIKGRTCINGAPQREYIKKEDAASPTVATDSIFITGTIDAHEERDTATCDLPGAFLHTITDEKVIMVLRGVLCEMMVKVDPKLYRKYVTTDKRGKPVLYVQLYKSLYGLMRSALLFYRKLRGELEAYGFKINPYDPCVANKDTPGGQLTVLWHVDDLKVSCKDKFEVTKVLMYLKGIYGEKNFSVTRGDKHEYLGEGAVVSSSKKQKINTRSSTETELVGVDDAMPTVLWCLYFIQEQGYNMTHAIIYQDNKSAILLETNGKMSSSGRTKHIKTKFFFITDKVEQGEAVVEYKPTEEMWIDVNTKPKCGTPYKVDRSKIMNCPIHIPDETLPKKPVPTTRSKRSVKGMQECVGGNGKLGNVRSQNGVRSRLASKLANAVARAAVRVA